MKVTAERVKGRERDKGVKDKLGQVNTRGEEAKGAEGRGEERVHMRAKHRVRAHVTERGKEEE